MKFDRLFSFGGVRKMIKMPVSMPHRVIIEPNMPRQGYSHMTWDSLNGYYLENIITRSQYTEFLNDCAKLAYQVYSKSRNKPALMAKGSLMTQLLGLVVIVFVGLLITLAASEWTEESLLEVG